MRELHIPDFLRARQIAKQVGVSKRTIHRRAIRERWPARSEGNKLLYLVPRGILRKGPVATAASGNDAWTGPLIGDGDIPRFTRLLCRFAAVIELNRLLACGIGREAALRQAAAAFRFKASVTSLRAWALQYSQADLLGLAENKRGHCGRKPGSQKRRAK